MMQNIHLNLNKDILFQLTINKINLLYITNCNRNAAITDNILFVFFDNIYIINILIYFNLLIRNKF